MKKLQKRFLCLIMLGAVLCFSQPSLVQAQENMVSIMSVQSNGCTTKLSFNGKSAICQVVVRGKKAHPAFSVH